jgi:acyl transferase domain-containing protein
MATTKKAALVICPGRGTYNKTEYGYLRRYHADHADFLDMTDAYRRAQSQPTVRALDSEIAYSLAVHSRGDNASPLIFACSFCDFLDIAADAFDVVAVTGNSMGWYTALACGGAMSAQNALQLINTMGTYMQEALIGGQVVTTTLDEDWRPIPGRRAQLLELMSLIAGRAGCELTVSIELGGMIVFAGNEAGLAALLAEGPTGPGRFPMRLQNHAGFHSPLQIPVSERAKTTLPLDWFQAPSVPMIDGRGHIWRPHATDIGALWDYTLGTQIVETYDFTKAVQVGVREFAPDCLIVLGPGDTLGGAVAQSLIEIRWRNLDSKTAFAALQSTDPFVLAMGREDQRCVVTGSSLPSERATHARASA